LGESEIGEKRMSSRVAGPKGAARQPLDNVPVSDVAPFVLEAPRPQLPLWKLEDAQAQGKSASPLFDDPGG
jgi:hypothetical protein